MNAAQLHLALTHVPVILSIAGLIILIIGMVQKNPTLLKAAFSILLVGGLFAIPVYLTGEGTEELVERLPSVSKPVIERHEDMGKNAFSIAVLVALLSTLGLLFFTRNTFSRLLRPIILIVALASAGIMIYTAHLGGQIRHTEMRQQNAPVQGNDDRPMQHNEASEDE